MGVSQLRGQLLNPTPLIQAYSSCMSAKHLWQVRACIGVVTKKLTAGSLLTLEVPLAPSYLLDEGF